MLGANITKLKADLKTAVNTSFQFNYINKKNLDVDVTAAMISSIAFEKGKDVTFLKYQIPEQILNLLLLPDIFVNVKAKVSYKFSTTYTFYLYEFLKDYLYKGEVIVKKNEFLNFINAPKKVRESKYDLQEKVFIPSIAELELKSDISVSYEFIPENRWREIKFIITENKKYKEEDIDEDIMPTFKNELDAELFLKNLQESLLKIVITNEEKLMEIPMGYEVQVRPRSGLALKHGI